MQFDLIQCTVTLNEKGATNLTTVVKSGPDAITPPEALILMNLHPPTSEDESHATLKDVAVVGAVNRDKNEEMNRLREKYGARIVGALFPAGVRPPQKVDDLDIPATSFAKVKAEPKTLSQAAKMDLATKLFEVSVMIPDNATDEDLLKLAREHKIKVAA